MKKLPDIAKKYFRFRFYFLMSIAILAIFLMFFSVFHGALIIIFIQVFGILFIPFSLLGLLIMMGAIELLAKGYSNLVYENWSYDFTPTELKIERGVIFKKYSFIPYIRIQNVEIERGILAMFLGFSSLIIYTASNTVNSKEGYIPVLTLEEAKKIRNWILNKIISKKSEL